MAAAIMLAVSAARAQPRLDRPARIAGRPNFNGIWQAVNTAYWNVEGHSAEALNERWKIEGGSPSVLMRLGWNRNSLPAGARVTVLGFRAKDGSLRASSRELKFPDGRRMDLGGSGSASAQDPKK